MNNLDVWGYALLARSCLSALCCGLWSARQGYPISVFSILGAALGLGAIPLTYLATEEKVDPSPPESMPAGREQLALFCWQRNYLGLKQGLCLGLILGIVWMLLSFWFITQNILPTFVTLFEGMSLKLPGPTVGLMHWTKIISHPVVWFLLWIVSLIGPALLYSLFSNGGYGFPIFGRVWRHCDRLWWLYTRQARGDQWTIALPVEVRKRLTDQQVEPDPPDFPFAIQCERDCLYAVLWMYFPSILALLGICVLAFILLSWAVVLPLYQLLGDL